MQVGPHAFFPAGQFAIVVRAAQKLLATIRPSAAWQWRLASVWYGPIGLVAATAALAKARAAMVTITKVRTVSPWMS
jgi:NhaP-type Na+/H+ or K+/H+ antiporter